MGSPVMIYKTKASSFINFMAREIFMASIKDVKAKRLQFDFNFNDIYVSLKIRISYSDNVDMFDIWGSSSDDDIQLHISIHQKNFNTQSYNIFNAELRDLLRHELEHIGQWNGIYGKAEIYGVEPSHDLNSYFTQPYEIDAFLYGLNYKRKYLKTNILDEIDTLLNRYHSADKTISVDMIKSIWIDRLKTILPHTLKQ